MISHLYIHIYTFAQISTLEWRTKLYFLSIKRNCPNLVSLFTKKFHKGLLSYNQSFKIKWRNPKFGTSCYAYYQINFNNWIHDRISNHALFIVFLFFSQPRQQIYVTRFTRRETVLNLHIMQREINHK